MSVDLNQFLAPARPAIPKIVHQAWLDRTNDSAPPPLKFQTEKYMMSVPRANPEYEIKIWNYTQVKELFDQRPELQRWKAFYFEKISTWIERCDFIRYIWMWLFGGVYLDIDFSCHHSFNSVVEGRTFTWVRDWIHCNELALGAFDGKFAVYNGFLAAAPGHPIWPMLCDFIMHRYEVVQPGLVINSTGPVAIGDFCKVYGLADEHKYPEMFVNRCLIVGEGFQVSAAQLATNPCTNITPLVSTLWSDSNSWESEQALYFVQFYVQRKHIWIVGILIFVCIVLFVLVYYRGKSLATCRVEKSVCERALHKDEKLL